MACLLFVSPRPMESIEATLTQFSRADDVAGPIRSVAARTCDLLPTAARVAELLHPALNLGDRVGRLAIRLTLGVPAATVELARHTGADLLRGDYHRLQAAGLCDADTLDAAEDDTILACVDSDRQKLARIRQAVEAMMKERQQPTVATPLLEPYEG